MKAHLLFHSVHTFSKILSIARILLESVFSPKLLNNPLASCSLIKFGILLLHTAEFDKSIVLPVFLQPLGFYFLYLSAF